jgi:VCBS repeat-containing protein
MRAPFRVRPIAVVAVGLSALGVGLALSMASAEAAPDFAATASITGGPQYIGDSGGTVFTVTVTNTGATTSIGAVEVSRPSNTWTVQACTPPAGWTAQNSSPKCRYKSADTTADDILPGQSKQFQIKISVPPGTANLVGTWGVTVSKSNQFDNPSLLTAAAASLDALDTTAYTFEVVDAVVANAPVAPGSACPPSNKSAQAGSTHTIVVCGRNHATIALTPSTSWSNLTGTFLSSPGTFSSGSIPANSGNVVLANWNNATVTSSPGQNKTIIATIGASANQSSPSTTLTGYEAVNTPPVANNDSASVAEDGALSVAAPGVLGNDTDAENQPLTAQLESGPAHAASFALHADGSYDYTPVADYAGPDSFTYRANDGFQTSSPATVSITVTAVNDAPVNTAPSSVTVDEDTTYVFSAGTLSVSDIDSGALDVSTHLTAPNTALTVGTSGVTVTGNGTDDVTVTGPVSAVATALDGATMAPAPGFSGSTSLTMVTSDLGHTGSGGTLTDTDVVSVTVQFVNDPPSFTPGGDQTVAEDAGAQSVAWATAISKGGPGESGQTLTFDVSNDNNTLFTSQPAISPSGTLTYQSAADAYGSAQVTVVLRDDGGTANGGSDSSAPVTFTITVTPVNDPPTVVNQTAAAHTNMRVHVTGLLIGASDAHDASPSYTPAFSLASVTPLSCAGCGVSNVNADGSFDFDPPAGGTGSYTLHYTVTDTGYPAPGATSAPGTLTITVSGPVIWFVNPAASGAGTGTLTDPFQALSSATAVATASERIFVHSGTVTGNVAQAANGWLIGQGVTGASFDAVMGITPPAGTSARPAVNGTRPTIAGGVSLASGSVVRGLNLTPASGTPGIQGLGVNGVTVGEVSVTATAARGLDVTGSQGSTIALTKVSSTGAPNGIRLSTVNTTTPGSVAVTGDGSTAGSGGTISGSTGAGVSLTNVSGVSLNWLAVSGSAAEGIAGSNVTGVSISDSTVSGSGVHGVSLANALGATALTRVTASGSAGDNARVFSSSGSTTVTVSDSTFRDNSATTGLNGLLVEADGSASMTLTASNNSYLRNRSTGLSVFGVSSAKTTATVTGGTWQTNGVGVSIVSASTGGVSYAVNGGTVTGCATCGAPVNVFKSAAATGTGANAMAGSVSGMTITNADSELAPGIWVHAEGAGASRVAVTGNNVSQVAEHGIEVTTGNGSSTMDATVTGNTVTLLDPLALQGIHVDAGTISSDTVKVCADIKTNVVVSPSNDIRVRNRFAGTTFRLPGYAGPATSTSSVVLFLISQNTITDAAAVVGSSPGFAGGAACAAP